MIVLLPVFLFAAALIKLTSSGPLFFIQTRGGRLGQPFRLVKFRTMLGDRKPDPKELVSLHHPDITRVGLWLRRLKIDELPQLLNVLRGDMSLVGPRPTLLDQVEAYDDFRRQRLEVQPGVTGLAQVYASSLASWDERILYDVAYVRLCSLRLDLWVLLRTVLVVLLGEHRTSHPFFSTTYAQYVDPPPDLERTHGPSPPRAEASG